MNLNKNLYLILEVDKNLSIYDIRKSYYRLSKKYHPDRGGDQDFFDEVTEAWSVISNTNLREEYDKKSPFGSNYSEIEELFKIRINYDFEKDQENYDKFKSNEINDIIINITESDLNKPISYKRFILCKECGGSGKDLSSKIVIRDVDGNIKSIFESDDGCDFCDGTGKSYNGTECSFCFGKGKVGIISCKTCNGEQRIEGKQSIKKVKLSQFDEENTLTLKGYGSVSKNEPGKIGDLIIKLKI